ncbi:hypothetical protein MWV29_001613 [Escherichia coli]|uniref:Uncharacterized protein n=1 Tax=Escherichia phage ECD7 TaxID=1981499 RepID=A0A220NTP7_9CAUD|nr:hypothetical protein FDH53_gp209 [Escherichia phage ECD7]EJA6573452.1 hypothetical protein [Escherichia coli]QZI93530.1 hypothetical protein NPJJOOEL_00210 [Enterobacteria phage Brandy]WNA14852.1 hypothetical protein XCVQDTFY_CDS0055 [Krischvirus RB49]ASJ80302.1 hypothetical protein ECD7_00210 [Escherichia phage ECD7]WNA15119.1 hypothetical protein PIJPGVCJ_CDS0055 [Krischvirus RB49]
MTSEIDIYAGGPYPSGELSNFNKRPFRLFGCDINSTEGFLQGLRFKNPEKQREIFLMHGGKAKRTGRTEKIENHMLYFQGRPIHRMSEHYYRLVHLAFVTMARNNPEFCKALLATGNKKLRHSIGGTDPLKTILTESEFCSILNDIRERLTKRGENVNS